MKCDECANFKPKREQTGWICRNAGCGKASCVRLNSGGFYARPNRCPRRGYRDSAWCPFYGKVVE